MRSLVSLARRVLCGAILCVISLQVSANGEPQDEIERIDAAWQKVVDSLVQSGQIVQDQPYSNSVVNRFEGYRSLLAITSVAYANLLFSNADNPEYIPDFGPLMNYCAPSPDYKYGIFHLDPSATYRVRGFRGDAEFIDLQQQVGWYGHTDSKKQVETKVNITFAEIDSGVDENGYYDFILSAEKPNDERHWWKLEEGVNALFIREFYIDYNTKPRSATFHIDRIDAAKGAKTSVKDVDDAVFRLTSVSRAQDYLNLCLRMGSAFPEGDNQFREERYDEGAGQINQRYFQARYNIEPDEALVIEWPVPKQCKFWSFSLYNDYWQVLNYGNRSTHLNKSMVDLDEGVARMIVSHQDPGVQNWIDVDGHNSGILLGRAKICGEASVPTLEKLSFDKIAETVAPGMKMLSEEQRQEQLKARREHYLHRYSR
ncbi:MAG: hypothetical protein ACWA5K_01450 [bacterium]